MMEAIQESILAITMWAMCIIILPALTHKALYIFAKVTFKIHKMKIDAKKYRRIEKILKKGVKIYA